MYAGAAGVLLKRFRVALGATLAYAVTVMGPMGLATSEE